MNPNKVSKWKCFIREFNCQNLTAHPAPNLLSLYLNLRYVFWKIWMLPGWLCPSQGRQPEESHEGSSLSQLHPGVSAFCHQQDLDQGESTFAVCVINTVNTAVVLFSGRYKKHDTEYVSYNLNYTWKSMHQHTFRMQQFLLSNLCAKYGVTVYCNQWGPSTAGSLWLQGPVRALLVCLLRKSGISSPHPSLTAKLAGPPHPWHFATLVQVSSTVLESTTYSRFGLIAGVQS